MSAIIRALADSGSGAGDWHIAVRSGGHSYLGFNNIANGVTIDLGLMNRSSYDPVQDLASVEPGAAWKDVYYNLLQNGNVTVTGGRDGGVGVGGFLLGGGNSYYTGRNGFGCDQVVNFEVVLANGSIVEASDDQNPALWKALKGGSLNFGIVTRFDLRAMPAVDLAYGQSVISSNYSDGVVDAVVEFTDHPMELGDDALITLYTHDTSISKDVTIILIRVNTKGNLNTTSFNRINEIPTLTKSWELESLADAANSSQVPAGTKYGKSLLYVVSLPLFQKQLKIADNIPSLSRPSRNTVTTLTFLNSPSVLRQSVNLHSQLVSSLSKTIGAENFNTDMIFQPLPSSFNAIGQRNGGNVLGLDRISSNAVLWTTGISIKNADDAALAIAQAELNAMTAELKDFARTSGTAAEFVYLNYADANQDPLGSYGPESVAFMKDVAREYDPQGWWQRRVPGGFKLSRVAS